MADLITSLPEINVEGKLIIFPAYTFYLQQQGYTISQRNDKISNRKLNEILMQANLAVVLQQEYEVPHIMVYNNKRWTKMKVGAHKMIHINAGIYGQYICYPTLISNKVKDESCINVIIAFLQQYSSAKISIRQGR